MTLLRLRTALFGILMCAVFMTPAFITGASAQKPCDVSQLRADILAAGSLDAQAEAASQYSVECQEEFKASLALDPTDYDVVEWEDTDSSEAARGTSCGTAYRSATKKTVGGWTAYVVTQNIYRCWDTSTWKLTSAPNHYVTFSSVDPLYQIQGKVSESEYWVTTWYDWRFYEQWQVKNCIWSGCLGTYYPVSQGNTYGNGNSSGSVSGG